ncbi:sensor histidine kinase [Fusibacter sp. 3D3]|uniref:sensor histidine kinase n=1 Tax=Fusibacter sp. 3D3 TaxID=1048380 RepID=UPI000852E873|nr:histidine kinase [Fusibacter sp. 3D3]GAU79559.1 two-component sensor histidine kinase [Fusibacter sp. 3D3]
MRLDSIRKKMMVYFTLVMLMSGMISVYISYNSRMLFDEIDDMFKFSLLFDDVENKLEGSQEALMAYVETKSSDSLNTYIESSEDLAKLTTVLLQKYTQKRGALSLENVNNMVVKYNQYSAEAIVAKRGRDIEACRKAYDLASETYGNIQKIIDELKLIQLDQNIAIYESLATNSQKIQNFNLIMIIDLILLTMALVYQVTYKMTTPIIKLSNAANEISKGHFDGETIIVESEDEVQIMAIAFEEMRQNIKKSIGDLKRTNEIESKLFEKELQTVKMQTLLNDAELRSLQSQINPHFLFNSLNAGVQLAMMENANGTLEFLEDMSAIFRYNIRPLDELVKVREEVDTIRAYCNMMKVRFGQALEFSLNVEDAIQEVDIMPLIIQPVVENAFIHGIGKKEGGGSVHINIVQENSADQQFIVFRIEDTGEGMSQEKINRIFSKGSSDQTALKHPQKSHSSGIGAGNVLQRLKLFYNDQAKVEIKSELGKGTTFTIKIPVLDREAALDV